MAGDYERYAHWCRRGLRGNGPASTHLRGLLLTNLASVETDAGNLTAALANAETAEQLTSTGGGNLVGGAICQQALLHAYMGHADSAAECIERATRQRLTASWMRAVKYTRGVVAELRGDIEAARHAYKATLPESTGGALTEVFELRALVGLVRTACDVGDFGKAHSRLSVLRDACHKGWKISESLLAEAEGRVALAEGNPATGCAHLVRAQMTAPHRL